MDDDEFVDFEKVILCQLEERDKWCNKFASLINSREYFTN